MTPRPYSNVARALFKSVGKKSVKVYRGNAEKRAKCKTSDAAKQELLLADLAISLPNWLLIGRSSYQGRLAFTVMIVVNVAGSILGRRQAINFFEIPYKMAFIIHPYSNHYLFNV